MIGMLKKDLYIINHHKKTLLLFMIIFFLAGINTVSFIGFGIVMAAMSSVTATFGYDEQANWDRYVFTLPISRNQIVKSKYILMILLIGLGTLFGTGISILFQWIFHDGKEITNAIITCVACGFGISLVNLFQLPFIYKYGTEKGRIYMFIPIAIIGFLGGVIALGASKNEAFQDILKEIGEYMNRMDNIGYFIIGLIILGICTMISYYFSKRNYAFKES